MRLLENRRISRPGLFNQTILSHWGMNGLNRVSCLRRSGEMRIV